MSAARRAWVDVEIGGVNVTEDISNDVLSLSYKDKSSDEVDDLALSIQNRSGKWLWDWLPAAGTLLHAKIITESWTGALDCGDFILDDIGFSGWPMTVSLKGVAMPVGSDFSEVERNRTWEQATLKGIAQTMADNAAIPFTYLAAYNPTLPFISQKDRTDKAFLDELCKKYGLTLKLYSNRIIIYDMAELEQNAAAVKLTPGQMTSFQAKSTITGAGYSGVSVRYAAQDGQVLEYLFETAGSTQKVYQHTTELSSLAEAERVAKSKLRELNMGETTFSCTLPGDTRLYAGMCVEIANFGQFDGKYFIDTAAHRVGGGYTVNLAMHRVVVL